MRMKNEMTWTVAALLLFSTMAGCRKDGQIGIGTGDGVQRNITFRINPFEAHINPMMVSKSMKGRIAYNPPWLQAVNGNVSASAEIQKLYLWTFNKESPVPDIGIDTLGASIKVITENGSNTHNYGAGFAYTPYPAGRALNIVGPKEIVFGMTISHVERLGFLRFDMTGSQGGPKDFSLSFSWDENDDFVLLSDENQFTSMTGKNTFEYDLSSLLLLESDQKMIYIKIIPREGLRPDSSTYSPSSGTIRIDNFALMGVYSESEIEPLNLGTGIVYYHIFHATDSSLALSGQHTIDSDQAAPEINLKLADGDYFVSFTVNFSDEALIFPASPNHAREFFIYQKMQDQNAIIYGTLIPDLQVSSDLSINLDMERYFSQVRFVFTDTQDLSEIHKIEIENLQKPLFFPYGPISLPDTDWINQEEKITYFPDLNEDAGIQFNQFLGKPAVPREVTYRLKAYNSGNELLREVVVSTFIRNNVQLSFVGKLLENTGNIDAGFRIHWQNEWEDPVIINF